VHSTTLRGREVPLRSARDKVAARARTKKMFRWGAAAPFGGLVGESVAHWFARFAPFDSRKRAAEVKRCTIFLAQPEPAAAHLIECRL